MDLEKLASLSVGLAGFIGGLWIVLQIVKSVRVGARPRIDQPTAGNMSPEYWQIEFRKAVEEGLKIALRGRNEEIREILREELENFQRRHP